MDSQSELGMVSEELLIVTSSPNNLKRERVSKINTLTVSGLDPKLNPPCKSCEKSAITTDRSREHFGAANAILQ